MEAQAYDVRLVPADVQLGRFVVCAEPMPEESSTRWDQLDQFIVCFGCRWVGHGRLSISAFEGNEARLPCVSLNVVDSNGCVQKMSRSISPTIQLTGTRLR